MLNVEKFQKQLILTIKGDKMVHEWTEEGEGDFVHWIDLDLVKSIHNISIDEKISNNIKDTVKQCIDYNLGYSPEDIEVIDNRITFNTIEDEDCNILGDEEKEKMFICDYSFILQLNGITIEEDELEKIFK